MKPVSPHLNDLNKKFDWTIQSPILLKQYKNLFLCNIIYYGWKNCKIYSAMMDLFIASSEYIHFFLSQKHSTNNPQKKSIIHIRNNGLADAKMIFQQTHQPTSLFENKWMWKSIEHEKNHLMASIFLHSAKQYLSYLMRILQDMFVSICMYMKSKNKRLMKKPYIWVLSSFIIAYILINIWWGNYKTNDSFYFMVVFMFKKCTDIWSIFIERKPAERICHVDEIKKSLFNYINYLLVQSLIKILYDFLYFKKMFKCLILMNVIHIRID